MLITIRETAGLTRKRIPIWGEATFTCWMCQLLAGQAIRHVQRIATVHYPSQRCRSASERQPSLLLTCPENIECPPFVRLVWDLRFDEFPKKDQRFLPAEIARFSRNDVGHTFLQHVHFRST